MKRSIYEIQNPKDYEPYFTDNNIQENIIQALANMGQRLGIKGDGIKYNSFTFSELIDDDLSAEDNIGYIRFDNNNDIIVGISDKNLNVNNNADKYDPINPKRPEITYTSISNRLFLDNDFVLEIPVNNIEKYAQNSILSNDSKYFKQIMVGKYFGYDDDDKNNCEYIYNKFEINTNKLLLAYRAFYVGSNSTSDFYCLLKLEYVGMTIDENVNDVPKYELTFQIFDLNYLNEDLREKFVNSFVFSKAKEVNNMNLKKFDFLDKKYLNDEEIEKYDDTNDDTISNSSIIAVMLNYADNKYDYGQTKITYAYNTNTNIFFYTDNTDFKKIENNIRTLYGVNIVERMIFIGNDITVNYENFMKYFNDKYYFINKKTLLLKILFSIYQKIELSNGTNNHNCMFVPLDYKFHYICNSENEIEIYYSNNIFVNLMNLYAEYDIKTILDYGNIIYAYNGESKIKVYNFEVNYNKDYSNVINEIQVKDLYTLPYINAEYNWSINDKNTYISALGKDAGNPNIIIVYSGGTAENSHKILNNIYNKNQIDTEWEIRQFNVSNDYFTGLENEDSNENPICYAWIPKITIRNIKYLYDSIIISVSNINCFKNDKYAQNYNGKYVISIWTLSEIDNDVDNILPKYVYLTDNTESNPDIALTFGTIANNQSDIEETSKNIFDILLLKAKTNTLAQTVSNDNTNNWIIFKNKTHSEYVNGIAQDEAKIDSDYNNDLNLMIQFNDTINLNSTKNNVTYSQSNKYLGSINDSNSSIKVTNKAYPKYVVEYDENNESNEEQIKVTVIENDSKLVLKTVIYNKVSGTETISTDYIENKINYVDNIYSNNNTNYDTKRIYTDNSYFDDYVFNDNVPNLDLKEIILKNINTLNRVNILSLDDKGNIYNSYIGCNFDKNNDTLDKNVLHIASNMTNVNIGSETLINEEDRYNFKTQDTLSIDFQNIIFNTKNSIVSNNNIWTKQVCQGITFYTTSIRPIGTFESYDHSMFGFNNHYIKTLLSRNSDYANKETLKRQLIDTNSYILNEIGETLNSSILNNVLNDSETYLFLLNKTLNESEEENEDSIFRRINIYTNNDENVVSNNEIYNSLYAEYENLMKFCKIIDLTENKLEVDISEYKDVNFSSIIYETKISNSVIANNGEPIRVDLVNKKITAIKYGACMVILSEREIEDINDLPDGKIYVLFVNSNLNNSRTVYECININKLFKYKLGKDINNITTLNINTKNNKLIDYAGYHYLIINNPQNNLNQINDNIYYYDNEMSLMYYMNGNELNINISFERDNYSESNPITTKFNIIQNTLLDEHTSLNYQKY